MRVVLDTNVLLSLAMGSQRLQPLLDAWESKRFMVLISEALVTELAEVMRRPKITSYLSPEEANQFLSQVLLLAEWVEVSEPHPDFVDPKDRFLLGLGRDGAADALVTGDKALLSLGKLGSAAVMNPAAFIPAYCL